MFFYIGFLASTFFSLRKILMLFVGWNFIWMLLQKTGMIGGVSVKGIVAMASQRVYGIASFPSEMGALLSMLFCFFLLRGGKERKPNWAATYFLFLLFSTFTIFTGSRIAIAAIVLESIYGSSPW